MKHTQSDSSRTSAEIDAVKELARSSGNNFHWKVIGLLRSKGWKTLVSPYYQDNFTDKPREVDIVAEKSFPVIDVVRQIGSITLRVFVECKYINARTLFWMDQKDMSSVEKRIRDGTIGGNADKSEFISTHHYYSIKEAAKLFDSDATKTTDKEIIYKAINQSLNALVFYRPTLPRVRGTGTLLATVNYPLIVCSSFDRFYQVPNGDIERISSIRDAFQLEIQYISSDDKGAGKPEYMLIDVIDFQHLPIFLEKTLEKEAYTLSRHFVVEKIVQMR